MFNNLFDKLTTPQKDAVRELENNLQIIACAGSGKTTVISRRIANILAERNDVLPKNVVAFTFTEKAANSLRERIKNSIKNESTDLSEMYVGTIHGFCNQILHSYTDFRQNKVLNTARLHLFIERYERECGLREYSLRTNPRDINLFIQCIEKMIDDYDNRDLWCPTDRRVLQKYLDCLYGHGFIDFSTMIFETLRQIDHNTQIQEYLSMIKYLVVDEYQDVNDLQEKLINTISKAGANICVVGDDDQTIYQFRGSNANNIISFASRYSDVHQVKLETNFRCSKSVVDVADKVILNNTRRLQKTMKAYDQNSKGSVTAIKYNDKNAEYLGIANTINSIHSNSLNSGYGQFAILVRTNKSIPAITKALDELAIPYIANCTEKFFEGKYFKLLVNTLRILEKISRADLYDIWENIADKERLMKGFKMLRRDKEEKKNTLGKIICNFCEAIGFLEENASDIDCRKSDYNAFIEILNDFEEIYGDYQLSARIQRIMTFLEKKAAEVYKNHRFETEIDNDNAVQVMTIHKSKGLEFDTVFLPDLMQGYFPVTTNPGRKYWHILGESFTLSKEKYQSDIEDERKLFYVALTRAKKDLFMTYVLDDNMLSDFVKETAISSYIDIDKGDIEYIPPYRKQKRNSSSYRSLNCVNDQNSDEQEALDEFEYWENVKYARRALYDYYGTACHFNPAAYGDLERIKNMDPNEILELAVENGLISM